jgi:hypothetical protein
VYDAIHAQQSKPAEAATPVIAKPTETPPERV